MPFNLHTVEEFEKDFFESENVNVCCPGLKEKVSGLSKMYSEVVSELVGENSTDRAQQYLNVYAIPIIDKAFTKEYGAYASEDGVSFKLISEHASEELADEESIDNLFKLIGRPGKYVSFFIISKINGYLEIEGFFAPIKTTIN